MTIVLSSAAWRAPGARLLRLFGASEVADSRRGGLHDGWPSWSPDRERADRSGHRQRLPPARTQARSEPRPICSPISQVAPRKSSMREERPASAAPIPSRVPAWLRVISPDRSITRFPTLLDAQGLWKRGEALRDTFRNAGVDLDKPLIGELRQRSHSLATGRGAALPGKQDVTIYDGAGRNGAPTRKRPRRRGLHEQE